MLVCLLSLEWRRSSTLMIEMQSPNGWRSPYPSELLSFLLQDITLYHTHATPNNKPKIHIGVIIQYTIVDGDGVLNDDLCKIGCCSLDYLPGMKPGPDGLVRPIITGTIVPVFGLTAPLRRIVAIAIPLFTMPIFMRKTGNKFTSPSKGYI